MLPIMYVSCIILNIFMLDGQLLNLNNKFQEIISVLLNSIKKEISEGNCGWTNIYKMDRQSLQKKYPIVDILLNVFIIIYQWLKAF